MAEETPDQHYGRIIGYIQEGVRGGVCAFPDKTPGAQPNTHAEKLRQEFEALVEAGFKNPYGSLYQREIDESSKKQAPEPCKPDAQPLKGFTLNK